MCSLMCRHFSRVYLRRGKRWPIGSTLKVPSETSIVSDESGKLRSRLLKLPYILTRYMYILLYLFIFLFIYLHFASCMLQVNFYTFLVERNFVKSIVAYLKQKSIDIIN